MLEGKSLGVPIGTGPRLCLSPAVVPMGTGQQKNTVEATSSNNKREQAEENLHDAESGVSGTNWWYLGARRCRRCGLITDPPRGDASWLPAVDKSRGSKSVEVQRVWEVYDERLQYLSRQDALQLDESLDAGDVSRAWLVWSGAAETALVDACQFSGGPTPDRGFVLGREVCCVPGRQAWWSQVSEGTR